MNTDINVVILCPRTPHKRVFYCIRNRSSVRASERRLVDWNNTDKLNHDPPRSHVSWLVTVVTQSCQHTVLKTNHHSTCKMRMNGQLPESWLRTNNCQTKMACPLRHLDMRRVAIRVLVVLHSIPCSFGFVDQFELTIWSKIHISIFCFIDFYSVRKRATSQLLHYVDWLWIVCWYPLINLLVRIHII